MLRKEVDGKWWDLVWTATTSVVPLLLSASLLCFRELGTQLLYLPFVTVNKTVYPVFRKEEHID